MSGEPSGNIRGFEEADRHLKKALPRRHILFVSVGTIIGSDWLSAMSDAGPSAAFLVGCVFFGVVTTTSVLTVIMGGAGVAVLRRHAPGPPRPRAAPPWGTLAAADELRDIAGAHRVPSRHGA